MILLAIMSYPGGNAALARHWTYFERSGADKIVGIAPYEGKTVFPAGIEVAKFGNDSYIDGPELPQRLIWTLVYCEALAPDYVIVAEYDTVFFKPIDPRKMTGFLASHYSGGQTWGSKAKAFYHNPWVFKALCLPDFIAFAQKEIDQGVCGFKNRHELARPEGSPDVFFGYCAQELGLSVQTDLWSEYTQNDLKDPAHLEAARVAYHNGVAVIHGIKTAKELEIIMGDVGI
jgi:hypothetical protein